MLKYIVYGLSLHSVIPLPELITLEETKADVEVRLGHLEQSKENLPIDEKTNYYYCWNSEEGTFLYWRDVATFLIRNGREIIIDPVSGAEEKRIRLILLGAVLSILLNQREYLVFHASALSIDGNGVIFLGNKGWGKSTMAAALHRNGHSFLSDDVVAIDDTVKAMPFVLPAFPQIKLWSDAISSMGNNLDQFPKVASSIDKREHRFTEGFSENSVPLKCIYILGVSDKPVFEINLLSEKEALLYLIAQTYNARWGKQMFAKDSASHLLRCTNLVKTTPVYRLTRPKSLELLPIIAEMVEKHILKTQNGKRINRKIPLVSFCSK